MRRTGSQNLINFFVCAMLMPRNFIDPIHLSLSLSLLLSRLSCVFRARGDLNFDVCAIPRPASGRASLVSGCIHESVDAELPVNYYLRMTAAPGPARTRGYSILAGPVGLLCDYLRIARLLHWLPTLSPPLASFILSTLTPLPTARERAPLINIQRSWYERCCTNSLIVITAVDSI